MANETDLVEALTVLDLKPGDKLAVRLSDRVSSEAMERLRGHIGEILPGYPVLILDAGMDLYAIRDQEAAPTSPLQVLLKGAETTGSAAYILCDRSGTPLPMQEMCTVTADGGKVTVTVRLCVDGKSVRLGSEEDVLRRVLG